MKIATWNANMAFRKKLRHFTEVLDPDVYLIQECESPEYFANSASKPLFWKGNNRQKGLAVFSKLPATLIEDPGCDARYFMSFTVGEMVFIGIWAMNDKNNPENRYIGQVWHILKHHVGFLDRRIILLGDFNWNLPWDAKPKYPLVGNFQNVIDLLAQYKIESGYHRYFHEDFGKETIPTEFLQRKRDKPYHIDFIFLKDGETIHNFFIGKYQEWVKYSDHMPLLVEI